MSKRDKKKNTRPQRVKKTWIDRFIIRLPRNALLLAALLLGVLLWPFVGSLFYRDRERVNDSDLQWKVISIPDNENAFSYDSEIRKAAYEPAEPAQSITKMIEGITAWDDSFVAPITAANFRTCELILLAAQKEHFQDPQFANISPKELLAHQNASSVWRKAARVCALHAVELARNGKVHDGVLMAESVVKIGAMMSNSQSVSLNYLLGSSIRLFGLGALRTIAQYVPLSRAEAKQLGDAIAALPSSQQGAISALQAEYLVQAAAIDMIHEGNTATMLELTDLAPYKPALSLPFYFHPNTTKESLATFYRSIITELGKSCVDYEPLLYRRELALPPWYKAYITPNLIGGLIRNHVVSPSTGFIEKRCADEVNVGLTGLMVALRTYHADYGNYPKKLQALVPMYITKLPLDPYSGKEYLYDVKATMLGSVGPKTAKDANGVYGHNPEGLYISFESRAKAF